VSERSDELRRQRDVVRQHLAWLDRQLAAQEGIPAAEPLQSVSLRHPSVTASDADRDAEAILAEFRQSGPSIASQTKRGCILYFAIAIGLLLAVVLGFAYHYAKNRR
jgi:hypothetical protein